MRTPSAAHSMVLKELVCFIVTSPRANLIILNGCRSEPDCGVIMEILDRLRAQARQNSRHIVLFEGEEDRTLAAAAEIEREGIARLTLLGDKEKIRARIQELGLRIEASQI